MHGYWDYDGFWWRWPLHGFSPFLGLLLVIAIAWILLRDRRPHKAGWSWPAPPPPESARDILDKRYARGEITRDQYEAMKRDLAAQ